MAHDTDARFVALPGAGEASTAGLLCTRTTVATPDVEFVMSNLRVVIDCPFSRAPRPTLE